MLLLLQCLSDPSGLVKHVGSHLRRGPKREPQGEESHVWKITHLDFTCFRATESQTSGGGGCGKGKRPGIGSLYKISWCISFFSRYIHFINSSFNLCKDVFMNSFVYLLPRSGRSPGEGSGYPLQYSCLVNPIDRGAWQATVHVVAESDMTEWLTCLIVF